jgi:hypothetical protein
VPYSEKQQKAAGAALGMKRKGKVRGKGAAASMARGMSEEQLSDYASGPIKKKVKKRKKGGESMMPNSLKY